MLVRNTNKKPRTLAMIECPVAVGKHWPPSSRESPVSGSVFFTHPNLKATRTEASSWKCETKQWRFHQKTREGEYQTSSLRSKWFGRRVPKFEAFGKQVQIDVHRRRLKAKSLLMARREEEVFITGSTVPRNLNRFERKLNLLVSWADRLFTVAYNVFSRCSSVPSM